MMYLQGKEWIERGKVRVLAAGRPPLPGRPHRRQLSGLAPQGEVTVVHKPGSKAQLVVRNDSANRLMLLNINLFPELTPSRLGANAVLFSALPNPPLAPKCVVCGVRPRTWRRWCWW
jgi:hypothetical protein